MLFALGIRFVGETTAKKLAARLGSLDAIAAATREQLLEADEVGEKIADSVIQYLSDEDNLKIIARLRKAGVQFSGGKREGLSDSLGGRTFVISGTFAAHSRDQLKELIELHGGKNLAAVSSNTDFLLAGANMGPAKLAKAQKLGVEIIDEERFLAMIGEGDGDGTASSPEKENNPVQGSLF